MVNYNPKEWSFFIFKMHKADTVRKLLPMLIYMTIYSIITIYLLKHFLPEHLIGYDKNLTIMHSLLGFVISMLLVFRTNTAYDRWWEGRKVWGSLINTSRNLLIKNQTLINTKETQQSLNQQILDFADALKDHLRKHRKDAKSNEHQPLRITHAMYKTVTEKRRNGLLSETEFLAFNNDLQLLMDYTGICERIRNTPIPFMYSMFIKNSFSFIP